MTRLVGIRYGGEPVTVLLSALQRRRVIDLTIAGQPVIVWWQPGTAPALTSPTVAGGPDVGAAGAFSPVVHGRRRHFLPVAGGFRDRETASHWSVLAMLTPGQHLAMDWRRPHGPAASAGSRRWKFLSQAACLIAQAPSGRWQPRRERGEFRFRDRRRHQL